MLRRGCFGARLADNSGENSFGIIRARLVETSRQNSIEIIRARLVEPSECPPQGEGSLKCLCNTLRAKPAEQKRFYECLQRLDTRPRGLGVGEQSRVDAIWSLVEDAVS